MAEGERKIVTLDDIEKRHVANHIEPYFAWIRQVVTLATGALTVLLGLQGHYVPLKPLYPWVLVVAWVSLAATIGLGLLALSWSHRGPLKTAQDLRQQRLRYGDAYVADRLSRGLGYTPTPASHRWSVRLMSATFLVALAALCWFSAVNLLR